MTDSLQQSDGGDDAPRSDHVVAEGMPRWVKVSVIVGVVLVLLVALILITGGPGNHGPGRH